MVASTIEPMEPKTIPQLLQSVVSVAGQGCKCCGVAIVAVLQLS